jgi:hypothetical protein
MNERGRLLDVDLADIHGQYRSDFPHAAISRDDDFQQNGSSLYRICRTMMQGSKRYRDYPDLRVREPVCSRNEQTAHRLQC